MHSLSAIELNGAATVANVVVKQAKGPAWLRRAFRPIAASNLAAYVSIAC
jgi:hypothetical protein